MISLTSLLLEIQNKWNCCQHSLGHKTKEYDILIKFKGMKLSPRDWVTKIPFYTARVYIHIFSFSSIYSSYVMIV